MSAHRKRSKSRGLQKNQRQRKKASAELAKDLRVVVGHHACKEALRVRPEAIKRAWFQAGTRMSEDFENELSNHGVSVEEVSIKKMNQLGQSHQGFALMLSEGPEFNKEDLLKNEPQTYVFLDQLEDPHNLGAILRTAWLLGVKAIFVTDRRSAQLTPTVCKIACGGAEHVPVVVESNVLQLMEEFKKNGFWLYGLSAESAQSLWEVSFADKTVLFVGAEAKGLRKSVEKSCDERVFIPQKEAGASYNASVAAALAISEVSRQHHLRA